MADHSLSMAGEIDTAAPFESVKAAVTLFDEIADARALKFPSAERRASLELQQLRENLTATKQQLSQAQTAKNSLFLELVETKRLVELKTSELAKVLSSKPSTSEISRQADETYTQIEAVSSAVQEKYDSAVATLATTEEEVERLNAEIEISVAALEEQQAKESVLVETGTSTPLETVVVDDPATEGLKQELAATKESEDKLLEEIAGLKAGLESVKAEVDQARESESKATKAANDAAQELSTLRSRLETLVEEKTTLAALAESLREQLVKAKMELETLRDAAESEGQPSSSDAAAELQKVRAELTALIALEAKAKETVAGVSQALQRATFEADESRVAAETALEDAHKARQELEEAKAAAFTAESRLEAATREAQAAKAGESMAMAELKLLSEKKDDKDALGKSKKENENLRKRLQEAEELVDMKIAAAAAKVDAAKASEREIRSKLDTAKVEVESNRAMARQALHRAETAEAAKSAIENELRRRRKAATTDPTGSHQRTGSPLQGGGAVYTPDRRMESSLARRSFDYASDQSFVSADVTAESIAQLLQLKVSPLKTSLPIAEKPEMSEKSEKSESKKKKSKPFMKLGSYLSRRKSSVGSTSPRF